MFPFQKIFTMLIRTFSRPMLGYVKRKHQKTKDSLFASFFIVFGRRWHSMEHWVNHSILKTNLKRQKAELKDDILLQKGVEAFYEILFYLIVLGLPFWELYKNSITTQKKQEGLQKRIFNLQRKMDHINEKVLKIVQYSKQKSKQQKQKIIRDVSRKERLQKLQLLPQKQLVISEAIGSEDQKVAQKLEQILQNAIQVMADEFQDSLDDLQFSSQSQQMNIDDPSADDSDIEDIQIQGNDETSDLLEQIATDDAGDPSDLNISPQMDLQIQIQVPTQTGPL